MNSLKFKDPGFLPDRSCDIDISFSTSPLVLKGPNGIGKSTLLKKLFLQSPNHQSFLPQEAPDTFYDRRLSVFRSLILGLPGLDRAEFNRLWEAFELQNLETSHLSQLSGGEKQALQICLFLSKKANRYLLDEPSTYLDDKKKQTLANILTTKSRTASVILVEHNSGWIPVNWDQVNLRLQSGVLIS